jgi:uncharacterized membrane protein
MRAWRSAHHLVIVAGYVLGALALYWGLPTEPLGAPMVAFLLPTAAAVTDLLLRRLCVQHPVDEAGARHVLTIYDAIMLRFGIFVMGVHGAVLLAMLGLLSGQTWAAQIVPLMLGFTLMSIGNLFPKTRPNLAIGIRTRRTLSDRALWIRTHRFAGYLAVACGAVIVLSAIAVPRPVGPGMILIVGPAALAGTGLLVRLSGKRANA